MIKSLPSPLPDPKLCSVYTKSYVVSVAPLTVAQVLSPLKYVVASFVPVADNSVVPTVPESIFQVAPEFDTVISPLSPSDIPPPIERNTDSVRGIGSMVIVPK